MISEDHENNTFSPEKVKTRVETRGQLKETILLTIGCFKRL